MPPKRKNSPCVPAQQQTPTGTRSTSTGEMFPKNSLVTFIASKIRTISTATSGLSWVLRKPSGPQLITKSTLIPTWPHVLEQIIHFKNKNENIEPIQIDSINDSAQLNPSRSTRHLATGFSGIKASIRYWSRPMTNSVIPCNGRCWLGRWLLFIENSFDGYSLGLCRPIVSYGSPAAPLRSINNQKPSTNCRQLLIFFCLKNLAPPPSKSIQNASNITPLSTHYPMQHRAFHANRPFPSNNKMHSSPPKKVFLEKLSLPGLLFARLHNTLHPQPLSPQTPQCSS